MSRGPVPFERVVDEHGAVVLRVCRAVVGPNDADDAWSETFLAALRAYDDLDEGADVRAWLVTIAHRKAIDLHRARTRRPVPVADAGVTSPSPQRVDETGPAWDALTTLSERQRLAVAYHHVAGLPHRTVARLIGGTEAACRRAAADGVAALRRILTDDPDGAPR